MLRSVLTAIIIAGRVAGGAGPARAAFKQEGHLKPEDGLSRDESNRRYFTDSPVLTHEGKESRFYTDLLKDRVVLVSFFYTDCPTAQQDMSKLAEIQKLLGDQMAKDVFIVALSVDPDKDDLKAIRSHATRYKAGKGWTFITGKKDAIEAINRKLGNTNPVPEFHPRLYLLGNLRTGHWMKMNQYAPSPSVVEGLRVLIAE
jgi:protein SCO1/2